MASCRGMNPGMGVIMVRTSFLRNIVVGSRGRVKSSGLLECGLCERRSRRRLCVLGESDRIKYLSLTKSEIPLSVCFRPVHLLGS